MKKGCILFAICFFILTHHADGRILKNDFVLNSENTGGAIQQNPKVLYNSYGERLIVCESTHFGESDVWLYLPDSGVEHEMRLNDDPGFHDQYQPDICTNLNDITVTIWVDERNENQDIYGQIVNANHKKTGDNFKINTDISDAIQQNPAADINSSNAFVVVWEDFRDDSAAIYGQKYNADGQAVWSNFKVASHDSSTHAMAADVVLLESDSFIVCWHDNRNGNDDVFIQWYDSFGNTAGSAIRVNQDTSNTNQRNPDMFFSESGRLFISWQDARNGDNDVYFQEIDLNGNLAGSNILINDDNSGTEQTLPRLAFRDNKLLVVTWLDERNSNSDVYAQVYSSTLSKLASNFILNDDAVFADQSAPDLAIDLSGNFDFVWSDNRNGNTDIYLQSYSEQGIRTGNNVKLNSDTLSSAQVNPDVVMNHSGLMLCVWESAHNRYNDIFIQFIDKDGNAIGNNIQVNTNTGSRFQRTPACDMNESGASVIVWRYDEAGQADIRGQRYDENQNPAGDNFTINTERGSVYNNRPAVAIAEDGSFCVAWRDKYNDNFEIYMRKYASDGIPEADPFIVNDDVTQADQRHPAIDIDQAGNIIVIWEDNRTGDYDIFGQFYNEEGVKIGNNVRFSDDSFLVYHGSPSVDVDTSGLGVAVWRDNRNGNPDIYGQGFSMSGEFIGQNFMAVEDSNGLRQEDPDVAIESDGKIVITCQETSQSGIVSLLAKRFSMDYQPLGETLHWIPDSSDIRAWNARVTANHSQMLLVWQDTHRLQGWDITGRIMDWEWEIQSAIDEHAKIDNKSQFLVQNSPNPFNGQTWISFQINKPGYTSIVIYNLKGQKVQDLSQTINESGHHRVLWNGRNMQNEWVSSGIYLVRVQTGEFINTHRMLFLK